MIAIKESIVVEGNYDKIKLSNIVNAPNIIVTNGFGIFTDKQKTDYIKSVAKKTGIVVFTDSDWAGFQIRSRIKQLVPSNCLKHAYTPDIEGKERRKKVKSKEGLLGVEGMNSDIILNSLKRAGCTFLNSGKISGANLHDFEKVTKNDFYKDGLSGGQNSVKLRAALKQKLDLPDKLSVNALIDAVNTLCGAAQYKNIIKEIKELGVDENC